MAQILITLGNLRAGRGDTLGVLTHRVHRSAERIAQLMQGLLKLADLVLAIDMHLPGQVALRKGMQRLHHQLHRPRHSTGDHHSREHRKQTAKQCRAQNHGVGRRSRVFGLPPGLGHEVLLERDEGAQFAFISHQRRADVPQQLVLQLRIASLDQ